MSEAGISKPRPGRTRQSKAKILTAAADLLAERGYAGFTVEAIVARSGVAKTTIYRHWPSRTHLAGEVIGLLKDPAPPPNTGSLLGDLQSFFSTGGATDWEGKLENIATMIDAAKDDPSLRTVIETVRRASLEALDVILKRGRERGEVAEDQDLGLIARILLGAVYFQHGHLNQPVTGKDIQALCDVVLHGCQSSPARRKA